jgi:hypothetical protein
MRPLDESKLPTLRQGNTHGDENLFLHSLLNYHLPSDDDQLPVSGPGARDFGPRTLAKVKKFQEVNKIDSGTRDFKDGIVGPHTWNKLLQKQQVIVTVIALPPPMPPLPPILPPFLMPPLTIPQLRPLPAPIPAPKLELSAQFQVGEQGQFPTKGPATASHSLQVVGVVLNKNDKERTHPEGQIGPTLSFNRGGKPDDSKTDLGFNAVLNVANLPGSGGRFSWSIQTQAALIKSLDKPTPPAGQLSLIAAANLTLVKVGDKDVLQVTAQAGGYLQAEVPNDSNDNKWKVTAGAVTFFGIAGTFAQF